MNIDVRWADDAKTIILWTMPARWTVADFDAAFQLKEAMVEGLPYNVDVVFDLRHTSLLPAVIFTHLRQFYSQPFPTTRNRIVVGADPWLRVFWQTFAPIAMPKVPLHFVRTLDEAFTYVRELRAGTPLKTP